MSSEQIRPALVFFSYSHQDKALRNKLEDHLSNLKYRGLISTWHDKEISAGTEWAQQIDIHLDGADIILLLISASFMASNYCYSIEMMRALERHEQREARVIPILLRPVVYTDAPFAKLQFLPTNAKPVVYWRDRDSAFVDIALALEQIVREREKWVGMKQTREARFRGLEEGYFPLVPSETPAGDEEDILNSYEEELKKKRSAAMEKRAYYAEALAAYEQALRQNNADVTAYRGKGNALAGLGRYVEALQAFDQAIRLDPYHSASYNAKGVVLHDLKRYEEALDAFNSAIDREPDYADAYNNKGLALAKLGKNKEAKQAYKRAQQLGNWF